MTPASEPNFVNPYEFQEAIIGLRYVKAPAPNSIQNRALKHFLPRAIPILAQTLNAVIRTLRFRTFRRHAKVIAILKLGKDPALHKRPISLLDTIGKLFEMLY